MDPDTSQWTPMDPSWSQRIPRDPNGSKWYQWCHIFIFQKHFSGKNLILSCNFFQDSESCVFLLRPHTRVRLNTFSKFIGQRLRWSEGLKRTHKFLDPQDKEARQSRTAIEFFTWLGNRMNLSHATQAATSYTPGILCCSLEFLTTVQSCRSLCS